MSVYLLTYDLSHKPEKEYEEIYKYIKSHDWARLSESSYAIESSGTPNQIWAKVSGVVHPNDKFLIITLRAPWEGRAQKDVIDWLQARLK